MDQLLVDLMQDISHSDPRDPGRVLQCHYLDLTTATIAVTVRRTGRVNIETNGLIAFLRDKDLQQISLSVR